MSSDYATCPHHGDTIFMAYVRQPVFKMVREDRRIVRRRMGDRVATYCTFCDPKPPKDHLIR